MNKYMVWVPWRTPFVVEVKIVKETPQRLYMSLVRPILGDIHWIPSWAHKDANLLFDSPQDALTWCESEAKLNRVKAEDEYQEKLAKIEEARKRLG